MFDILIVLYLFLGGLGAGILVVLGILGLSIPRCAIALQSSRPAPVTFLRYDPVSSVHTEAVISNPLRNLFAPGYGLAGACILVGITCLMVDLGRLDRVANLLLSPQFSYLTVGAYGLLISVFVLTGLGLVYARIVHHCSFGLFRGLQVTSVIIGVVVMLYTGMLLASMPSVPLWNIWCVPVLFSLSALSGGVACVLLYTRLNGAADVFKHVMGRLLVVDLIIIVAECAVLIAYIQLVPLVWPPSTPTGVAAAESLSILLTGASGKLFQLGYVMAGLLLPLVLELGLVYFTPRSDVSLQVFVVSCSALVLVGGFFMRWCVVMAGVQPVLGVLF